MWINSKKWLNELWCGDNIEVLKNIPDESVDLIYIDPPFFSNRNYELIWKNGAELKAYGDRWKGGIEHYLGWMVDRLKELRRILKETGSIYVHLDWHAGHYIKVEMDKIFGYENFMDEIAWCYEDVGGRAPKYFKRKHDVIFFYQKSNKRDTFNCPKKGLSQSTLTRFGPYLDKNGRLTYKRLKDTNPGVFRKLKGIPKNLNEIWLDKNEGQPIGDWWADISPIKNGFNESLGFQTQKPEALLERIIKTSSNEGDIVLDAFCGCGTTIAVAEKLNRKWIGIDVSPISVDVMTDRLIAMEADLGKKLEDFITLGIPGKTVAHLGKMDWRDVEDFVIQQIGGRPHKVSKVNDDGIDGFTANGVPIQVKRWQQNVGEPDVFKFEGQIRKAKSNKGKIFAFSFSKDAYGEAARAKRENSVEVDLVTMRDFLITKYGDHTHHEEGASHAQQSKTPKSRAKQVRQKTVEARLAKRLVHAKSGTGAKSRKRQMR
jgi:DNA modification methylase